MLYKSVDILVPELSIETALRKKDEIGVKSVNWLVITS